MGVIDTAQNYLGKVSYMWGGNVFNQNDIRTDCSGFTQKVYAENGVKIGRTTKLQAQDGKEVSQKELQQGDLILFKNTYTGANGISHVGIYMGDGKFIHNTGGEYDGKKDGVRISDLNSSYWQNHFATARRVIETENLPSKDVDVTKPNTTTKPIKGGSTLNPVIEKETAQSIDSPISKNSIIKVIFTIGILLLIIFFFIMALDIKPNIGGVNVGL